MKMNISCYCSLKYDTTRKPFMRSVHKPATVYKREALMAPCSFFTNIKAWW